MGFLLIIYNKGLWNTFLDKQKASGINYSRLLLIQYV